MKHKLITGILVFILITLTSSLNAFGENRNSPTTTLAFGAYELRNGSESVSGSQFSIALAIPFTKQWSYQFKLSSGNASGSHTDESGDAYTLEASTQTFSAGIKWNWILKKTPFMTPYISGGMALQNYSYEFNTPESDVGTTSGTGYGPLASFGVRFQIGRSFTLIPGYHYSLLRVTSESGEQVEITSAGTSMALIFGF